MLPLFKTCFSFLNIYSPCVSPAGNKKPNKAAFCRARTFPRNRRTDDSEQTGGIDCGTELFFLVQHQTYQACIDNLDIDTFSWFFLVHEISRDSAWTEGGSLGVRVRPSPPPPPSNTYKQCVEKNTHVGEGMFHQVTTNGFKNT